MVGKDENMAGRGCDIVPRGVEHLQLKRSSWAPDATGCVWGLAATGGSWQRASRQSVVSSAPESHPREPVSCFANDMVTTCTSGKLAETRIQGSQEK